MGNCLFMRKGEIHGMSSRKFLLYSEGNEYTSITGGWSASGYTHDSGISPATKFADSFYMDNSDTAIDVISTENKISFAGYTKLCVEWMHTDAANDFQPWFGVLNSKNVDDRVLRFGGSQINVREITTTDISDLNDAYYVAMSHTNSTYNGSGYLYAVWLEK